jgi:hypothetical protein
MRTNITLSEPRLGLILLKYVTSPEFKSGSSGFRQLLVLVMALTLSLAACSDGSNLPENKYFGKLPQIQDNWHIEMDDNRREFERSNDKNAYDRYKETEKKFREKYEADTRIETDNINGREIPVSYSDELKAHEASRLYTIGKVTIKANESGKCTLEFPITVKNNFTMPSSMNYDKWQAAQIWVWYLAKDGRLLLNFATSAFEPGKVKAGTTVTKTMACCEHSGCAYFSGLKFHAPNEKRPEFWKTEIAEKK